MLYVLTLLFTLASATLSSPVLAANDATSSVYNSINIPSAGTVGTPLFFSASATGTWSDAALYNWSLDDYQTASDPSATHIYSNPGTYQQQQNAKDAVGTKRSAPEEAASVGAHCSDHSDPPPDNTPTDSPPVDDRPATKDSTPPAVRIKRLRNRRRIRASSFRSFSGTASDSGSGVSSVQYALALKQKKAGKSACRFLNSKGSLSRQPSSCKKPLYLKAKGTTSWRVRFKKRLIKQGEYMLYVRATDRAGNKSRPLRLSLRVV